MAIRFYAMELNIELFEKIKAAIRAEPRRMNMAVWIKPERCGTSGCIGGWACILSGQSATTNVHDCAQQLLGIEHMPWQLFGAIQWPSGLWLRLRALLPGTPEYAEIVCEAIDLWIVDSQAMTERMKFIASIHHEVAETQEEELVCV